jgi:hypothetical protein
MKTRRIDYEDEDDFLDGRIKRPPGWRIDPPEAENGK